MKSGRKPTQRKIFWVYWQSTWQPQSPSGTRGLLAADEDTSWCYSLHSVPSGVQGTFCSYHVAVKGTDKQSHWNETNWCQNFLEKICKLFSNLFISLQIPWALASSLSVCHPVKSFCDDLFFQGRCRRRLCSLLEQGWVRHDSLFYSKKQLIKYDRWKFLCSALWWQHIAYQDSSTSRL